MPPVLSIDQIIKNQFSLQYEKFINDQFVGRDYWISIKSNIERLMLKKENNGIYFGKDGFLFEKMIVPSVQLSTNQRYLNEFLAKYPHQDISLIIPLSSYMIYSDKLPKHAPYFNQEEWLKQNMGQWPLVEIGQRLSQSSQQVYYRNDHHWTLQGAYIAYCALMAEYGLEALPLENFNVQFTDNFLGTYYAKGKPLNPTFEPIQWINPRILSYTFANKTVDSLIDFSKLESFDKYSAFLHGNHGFASIKVNDTENPNRILVIKDSFANSLIPFLTAHFDEIDVLDLRGYSGSIQAIIENNEYSKILFVHSFSQFSTDTSIAKLRY